jgi:Zn-dependent peptidase ImmA (M78 family)
MAMSPAASALQARRELSLGSEGPVPDILQRLEQDAGVNVVVAQLGEGPDGAYTVERDVPFILVNSSRSVVRQRFTLAHEFAHHRLQHGDMLDEHVRWDATDPKEVAANKFAAEFLLPIGAVNLWFESHQPPSVELATLVRLATAYGISCETTLWRVRAAGRLSQRDADRMKKRIDATEHWGMRSQLGLVEIVDTLSSVQDRQIRVPARMTDDVLKALDFGIIDRGVAAERLRISAEKLGEIADRREREDE